MLRIAPKLILVLLCGSALAGCATTKDNIAATPAVKEAVAAKDAPTDLDGGVRQAQLQRYAGHYDDAIRTLSQLMMVAADDPRVVAEYGKTLAEKGRAEDAAAFLSRAIELSANDWTLYSALGVSYDQIGEQNKARAAYEHALLLRREEPSVLNNYALSRMLAGDMEGAHQLIARAKTAGGASDAKIAANIAMLDKLAPAAPKPADLAQAKPAAAAPQAAGQKPANPPVAQAMPRPITAVPLAPPQPRVATAPANGVVMQKVPVDPLAGPARRVVTPVPPPALRTEAKPVAAQPKTAQTEAKPEAAKPETAKAEAAKPAAAKTAEAKPPVAPAPGAQPVKAGAKDQIPALRMSANAF